MKIWQILTSRPFFDTVRYSSFFTSFLMPKVHKATVTMYQMSGMFGSIVCLKKRKSICQNLFGSEWKFGGALRQRPEKSPSPYYILSGSPPPHKKDRIPSGVLRRQTAGGGGGNKPSQVQREKREKKWVGG